MHFSLLLFGLKGFPHPEGDAGLVEGLIGLDGHPDLIPDSHYWKNEKFFIEKVTKQKASLGTVDGDLPDQLIEALGVELLSLGADSGLPGLSSLQLVLKGGPELDDFGLGGGGALDRLDPEFLFLHGVLSGRQNGVENVLRLGLGHILLVLLPKPLPRLSLLGGRDLQR